MKKVLTIIGLLLLISCSEQKAPTKPFVIITKEINYFSKDCRYVYISSDNIEYTFFETNTKYNIGDTIK
ncbi:MAG TPA: hypothetical protein VIK86_05520 [Candidatus Paceibacterota bacterium]